MSREWPDTRWGAICGALPGWAELNHAGPMWSRQRAHCNRPAGHAGPHRHYDTATAAVIVEWSHDRT